MTMPDKIWVDGAMPLDQIPDDTEFEGSVQYIRADIVEGLASHIKDAENYIQKGHYKMAQNILNAALSKYQTIK